MPVKGTALTWINSVSNLSVVLRPGLFREHNRRKFCHAQLCIVAYGLEQRLRVGRGKLWFKGRGFSLLHGSLMINQSGPHFISCGSFICHRECRYGPNHTDLKSIWVMKNSFRQAWVIPQRWLDMCDILSLSKRSFSKGLKCILTLAFKSLSISLSHDSSKRDWIYLDLLSNPRGWNRSIRALSSLK